ncbi:phospholipase A [Halotalea alkalilenta]|uniref:phospholipase A n=1 Tax=Halotalea alkalilenta TaxID=376489 RepID=UPI0006944784|nr:phospholipase A [Halotalea alkalilenta]
MASPHRYPALWALVGACASLNAFAQTSDDDGTLAVSQAQQTAERARYYESLANDNPLAISTYRLNYILPYTYDSNLPRMRDYREIGNDNPEHTELKYQISLKVALAEDIFGDNGDLFLGYTQYSLWQAYNDRDSAPFRETNYEPELFLRFDNDSEWMGWTNTFNRIGYVHQSNGRGEPISRSWNRIYAEAIFQRGPWAVSIRPWWRIPESRNEDNNPDIENYLGYGELALLYTTASDHEISVLARGNPGKGNYGTQLDYTFPLFGRVRGYFQYYNGYGETLIDYDRRVNRVGLGVSFNPFLPGAAEEPYNGYHDVAAAEAAQQYTQGADDTEQPSSVQEVVERERRARAYFERQAQDNPLSLSTYRRNYVLPVAYNTRQPDRTNFASLDPDDPPDNNEMKFQISIKAKVWDNVFGDNGDLYLAYTQRSWWQAYNSEASSPFRETNYEPELFLVFDNDASAYGWTNTYNRIGFNHQSNGRADPISRSWNRVFAEATLERGPMTVSLMPWWRVPESDADDDNPDIEKYVGYADLTFGYTRGGHEFTWLARGNPGKGNFGNQLEYAFPLWSKVHGFIQYYEGYGESLIDYDHYVRRIGIGLSFNNVFLGTP